MTISYQQFEKNRILELGFDFFAKNKKNQYGNKTYEKEYDTTKLYNFVLNNKKLTITIFVMGKAYGIKEILEDKTL